MIMEENRETKFYICRGCGTENPSEAFDENRKTVYWFGAQKGTRDFWLLMSTMRLKILTVKTKDIPTSFLKNFDFYCIDCLLDETDRLGREKLRWETF